MPKQINNPFPGAALVRRFGLKGRFQPVLDEVVVPVINVESGDEESEETAAATFPNIPVAAGENSFLNLSNPTGSGVRIVLEGYGVLAGASCGLEFSLAPFSVVGATLVTSVKGWRESGLPGLPRGAVQAGSQSTASMPASIFYQRAATFGSRIVADQIEFVIEPGDEFTLWSDTANLAWTRSALLWREERINVTSVSP